MAAAIENPGAFAFRQTVEPRQQRHAERRVWIYEQMGFYLALRRDLQSLERLDSVVPQQFEQLKSVVKAHGVLPLWQDSNSHARASGPSGVSPARRGRSAGHDEACVPPTSLFP
jgi:hypothetical protein